MPLREQLTSARHPSLTLKFWNPSVNLAKQKHKFLGSKRLADKLWGPWWLANHRFCKINSLLLKYYMVTKANINYTILNSTHESYTIIYSYPRSHAPTQAVWDNLKGIGPNIRIALRARPECYMIPPPVGEVDITYIHKRALASRVC